MWYFRIVQKLKKEDENGNGKIEYEEWISFYHKNFKVANNFKVIDCFPVNVAVFHVLPDALE